MIRFRRAASRRAWIPSVLALACAAQQDPLAPKAFESPQAATQALIDAVLADDQHAVLTILGRGYAHEIVTADWDAERENRQRIARAAQDYLAFDETGDGEVEVVIGSERWPMPIPLVRGEDGRWHFDTAEGIEVLIDRRIGRNEITAIDLAEAYVDAQIEYARRDRDSDQVLEYAQRLASSDGQHDGLYWPAGPDEEQSPFGPLIAGAESYLKTRKRGDPIRGYYFKILTRQGEHPPGGAYDYVINGNMIAGFGLVAYPADYGNTGIMTFVVNHRGVVQQKDIGPFEGMDVYDPDDSWERVEPTDTAGTAG